MPKDDKKNKNHKSQNLENEELNQSESAEKKDTTDRTQYENSKIDENSDTKERSQTENYQELYEKEKDAKLRLLADIENERKRMQSQREDFIKMANASMVREIFEIVDDLNRATLNDASNDSLKMILNKLLGILNNFGYIPINFKEGDSFEAEKMEAISTVPVQEEEKNGKIVHVDQIGFIYKEDESIIRPAKVIVGKKV